MEKLEYRIEQLENKVIKIENKEEENQKMINEHNVSFATIISKLEVITKELGTITSNFKEAITRSEKRREERDKNIENRINSLEKNVLNLSNKLETDKELLEKKVDERTIEKDSDLVQVIIKNIIWLVLGGMLTYFATMLFK